MSGKCEFCKSEVFTRKHHLTPRCKGGKKTAETCMTCENFIHKTWNHNELRDNYYSVDLILETEKFQKFLKWKLKQPTTTIFKSKRGKNRDKNRYR